MPLQNWPAVVPPPGVAAVAAVPALAAAAAVAAVPAVPALDVALLLPQALTTRASAATTSGSFAKGLVIPLTLLNLTYRIVGGGLGRPPFPGIASSWAERPPVGFRVGGSGCDSEAGSDIAQRVHPRRNRLLVIAMGRTGQTRTDHSPILALP